MSYSFGSFCYQKRNRASKQQTRRNKAHDGFVGDDDCPMAANQTHLLRVQNHSGWAHVPLHRSTGGRV